MPMEKTKINVDIDEDLKDLIPQFMENRKKDIVQLSNLVRDNDLIAIAQLAHKIKGAAAGYGFQYLSGLAASMEKFAKSNDPAPLPQLVEDMKNHFDCIEVRFIAV
jgi:HPt (histidine-containing phosphotransfer) domain-containing protein